MEYLVISAVFAHVTLVGYFYHQFKKGYEPKPQTIIVGGNS